MNCIKRYTESLHEIEQNFIQLGKFKKEFLESNEKFNNIITNKLNLLTRVKLFIEDKKNAKGDDIYLNLIEKFR